MKLTKEKANIVARLKKECGTVVTRPDAIKVAKKMRKGLPSLRWLFNTKTYRGKERGTYDLSKVEKHAQAA